MLTGVDSYCHSPSMIRTRQLLTLTAGLAAMVFATQSGMSAATAHATAPTVKPAAAAAAAEPNIVFVLTDDTSSTTAARRSTTT